MAEPIMSKRKAEAISNGMLLIGIGVLFFTGWWWPGILLVVWIALGLRQYLTGRHYDFLLTSLILGGLFLAYFFKFDWSFLMPVLFLVGGIYIIFREYFFAEDTNGEDKSQEILDDVDDTGKKDS